MLGSAAARADAGLPELQEHMQRYVAGGQATLGAEAGKCLAGDQNLWNARIKRECKDDACLKKRYLERLGELDPLQPGVTAIRNLDLPRARPLAWIIPAAADQVAAPRRSDVRPLLATGTILDEVATGDGFVLRGGDGARYLLSMVMFLEPATTVQLQQMAKAGGMYTARRFAPVEPARGERFFDPSRCVFIYREP